MSNMCVPKSFMDGMLMYWVDLYEDDNVTYEEMLELRRNYADAMEDKANSVEDTRMYV